MFVSDVMQRKVLSVPQGSSIGEVVHLIFSKDISGVPVVRGSKLVGIVTEEDIFSRMYPSIKELVEDYPHARDFSEMEHNIKRILNFPVSKIMTKDVKTVTADTPLMKAQAMMLSHNFSRLPVVDDNNKLIGILSQGDVFRQIIRHETPKLAKRRKKRKTNA